MSNTAKFTSIVWAGKTFVELAKDAGIEAEAADRIRKQWLAQYPDIARFFALVERKPPVQDKGFLDGAGTYRVKLLSHGYKVTRMRGGAYVAEFQIIESDNERHPVGATRSWVCPRLDPPINLETAAQGAEMSIRTHTRLTRTGLSFTSHSWVSVAECERRQIKGRCVSSTPNVQSLPRHGATCVRCNMLNPDTEARPDYVCYECRT